MTYLEIKTVITDAYHPRALRGATINENDRLQLVYNIYTDPRQSENKIRGTHAQTNLMFAHGVSFSKEAWNYIIEMFFVNYGDSLGTVVALDAVNHCDSYQLNKGKLGWVFHWEDYGRDALKILKDLDLKGGTIMIGHSMGGASVLHAAALDKRLIDSVISIDPVGYMDKEAYFSNKLNHRDVYRKLLDALNGAIVDTFPTEEKYNAFMKKKFVTRSVHPRVYDDLLKANTLIHPRTGVTSYKTPKSMQLVSYASSILTTIALPDIVRSIDCEVCHIVGTKAAWNPPDTKRVLRERLPFCTPVDIPNGEHLVPLEMPEETFKYMQPFFEKRVKRIQELAKENYNANPNTEQEREDFFYANVKVADELFTTGKQLTYNRL